MTDCVALVDLDGTLADYHKAMSAGLAKLAAPGEPAWQKPGWSATDRMNGWFEPDSYQDNRYDLVRSQPGFWRSLPRIDDGFLVLGLLRALGFDVMVLT